MGTDESKPARQSHWKRWTGETGPFYRACAVFPFDTVSDASGTSSEKKPEIEVTSGITRDVLRNLPVVLLAVLAIYVPTLAFGFIRTGRLSVSVGPPDLGPIGLLVPGVLLAAVWLYLIYRLVTYPLRGSSLHRSTVFFGTALPLGIGTVYTLYGVLAMSGSTGKPAVTVQAGYFLFVLVAGHLVYDGLVLKTEHLLSQLGDTSIVKREAYDEFYREMVDTLGYSYAAGPITVPRSVVFALVVALGPLLLPFTFDSFQPWEAISYVAYNLVTLFVIAVFYDVFVLIYYFVELLRRDVLQYQPFHPDEHGGFRDLGRFAMHVNAILFVSGMYVAYRFYAEGVVRLSGIDVSSPVAALTWGAFYVGPLIGYIVLTAFWLYHSFLRIHREMKKGKQQQIENNQRGDRETDGSRPDKFTDTQRDAQPWQSLQGAPTWPVKRQSLVGVVIIDTVPIVASFVL
ncbi:MULTISPECIES: hypothetical protein [Haloarcula]|uniref:hypothetical protein n=1 Tax=Haloarcula TaxID=2237 RepID=UPI0023EDE6F3|nr:hypothetical protein [Halomicroarcula sp. XH51]